MTNPTCAVEGCTKPARSPNPRIPESSWCPMHYHRWYRHGDLNRSGVGSSFVRKYRSVYMPGHPLAAESGKVYVHRLVLFNKIGPGEHSCHWCDKKVTWTVRRGPDKLVADHLDDAGDNNHPDNLVPSCAYCNTTRGKAARLARLQSAGWWSSHDTVARLRSEKRRKFVT